MSWWFSTPTPGKNLLSKAYSHSFPLPPYCQWNFSQSTVQIKIITDLPLYSSSLVNPPKSATRTSSSALSCPISHQVLLVLKNLPADVGDMGDEGRFLVREDPLEQGIATHSSILVWKIPWIRGAWRAMVHGISKSQAQLKRLSTHTHNDSCIFHYSCIQCLVLWPNLGTREMEMNSHMLDLSSSSHIHTCALSLSLSHTHTHTHTYTHTLTSPQNTPNTGSCCLTGHSHCHLCHSPAQTLWSARAPHPQSMDLSPGEASGARPNPGVLVSPIQISPDLE